MCPCIRPLQYNSHVWIVFICQIIYASHKQGVKIPLYSVCKIQFGVCDTAFIRLFSMGDSFEDLCIFFTKIYFLLHLSIIFSFTINSVLHYKRPCLNFFLLPRSVYKLQYASNMSFLNKITYFWTSIMLFYIVLIYGK